MVLNSPPRYTKLADWEYIARCARAADPLPIVGNGDIFSFTEYEEHLAACPQLATTMLARGALIKPWLFTEVRCMSCTASRLALTALPPEPCLSAKSSAMLVFVTVILCCCVSGI